MTKMSKEKAAIVRFLYAFFRGRGLPKEKAESHLKAITAFNDDEFCTFLDMLSALIAAGKPPTQDLN